MRVSIGVWVDHMVDHFSTYLYQKRGFYYFSRRVPKELHHRHAKLPLNTRSRVKALKYAQVICQRLDERWLPKGVDLSINDLCFPPRFVGTRGRGR